MRLRPLRMGVLAAVLLSASLVVVLFVSGTLLQYLEASRAYALLPWTACLGLAAGVLGWRIFDHYQSPRDGNRFAVGLLLGGSLVGSILLWISAGERPLFNRTMFSVFGGPLLVGFWLWIGAVVGYAWHQQRVANRSNGG